MTSDHKSPATWPRTQADYRRVAEQASARALPRAEPEARSLALLQALIDGLWDAFGSASGPEDPGYSWVGVYYGPGQTVPAAYAGSTNATVPPDAMHLGPCRNKPACSPIGLQGMCGKGWLERTSLVIHDVRTLGEHYIACDPNDQSELVIPLFRHANSTGGEPVCWGVLDVDSYAIGAFAADEAEWLEQVCIELGLSLPGPGGRVILI